MYTEDDLIKLIKKGIEEGYTIPEWCGLPLNDHFDGIGGCWSISSGRITNIDGCKDCDCLRADGFVNIYNLIGIETAFSCR